MKRNHSVTFLFLAPSLFAVMTVSASPSTVPSRPLPSVTLPSELSRVLTDYEDAWHRRDANALSMLFTEDGFVLSPGHPPVRGRKAIAQHYARQGGGLSLRALAFEVHGAVAFIVGAFARTAGQPDIGKFTLTLRQDSNGRWLIFSDMDNGNEPIHPVSAPSGTVPRTRQN